MDREVISESFRVYFKDGCEQDFLKKGQIEYIWSLTPAGDLLIYLKEKHKTISMAFIRDERHAAYAAGTWTRVQVLETKKEIVEDEREESEVPPQATIH